MGLLPDTQNCGLLMDRECRENFPRHRLQRKRLVSDPGMHNGTRMKHVPRCMSGSLIRSGGENVPGIPGECATRNFAYLVRGPYIGNREFKHNKTKYNKTAYISYKMYCTLYNLRIMKMYKPLIDNIVTDQLNIL